MKATINRDAPVADPSPVVGEVQQEPNGEVRVASPAVAPVETPLILGKFKDQAALEAAYKELETKVGAPVVPPVAQPPVADPAAAQATAAAAGVDYAALTTEFAENGSLSPETYASLEKSGIPKPMVDAYIAGQVALADKQVDALASAVGGKEILTKVYEWAGVNLTDAELDAYNTVADTGNVEATKGALLGLMSKYTAAVGSEPKLVGADTGVAQGVQPFASNYEVMQAMKDKRYGPDKAYSENVYARLAVTKMFGN
jgi:hypothetical protein